MLSGVIVRGSTESNRGGFEGKRRVREYGS